ncbi:MAG TPA: methyltransferase domain-containing protein [Sediminibacterium sp.]|uniref:methyltransferase domain-containing protein n=1 Tax=Sediminibacterium sp. TaxID=1917865 RepID=UPI0008C76DD6|nr:methyltransferase domain-containing protein [Sediminibacterium sp.]OHC85289.1 MAG: SAM-dependent methyltransferase [Sphingobacteriia bacterium RIFOXYC2_FULL_35_18]HLD53574.1 methyltransferase domain-containing protein [Sediminibacterium sp.]
MREFLSADYWNERYLNNASHWDLGVVSPPLKTYIDQLADKNSSILIPGAGNSYEAVYLMEQGFTNITVIDIAPIVIQVLQEKYPNQKSIQFIETDFFKWEGKYDLIIEQTFFCALDPVLRSNYVKHMASLLKPNGKLVGLLFNRAFEGGPPFGGDRDSYLQLFNSHFNFQTLTPCHNSVTPRANTELFFIAVPK